MTKLMDDCGWLRIRELEKYHTLITLWKLLYFKKPEVLREKFNLLEDGSVEVQPARLQIVENSFKWRAVRYWNQLPNEVRSSVRITSFKKLLRSWIIENRPVRNHENNPHEE